MRLFAAAVGLVIFLSISMRAQAAQNHALDLVLPTDNDALFSGGGSAFYQYIERNYKGVKSTPWQGGQHGFVRDTTDTTGGVVYTGCHERIDIRPLHYDSHREQFDDSRAIPDGRLDNGRA